MAVKRHGGFETERVTGTQAARHGPPAGQFFPERHGQRVRYHHLEAVLARVTRPADDAGFIPIPRRCGVVVFQRSHVVREQARHHCGRLRALHGDEGRTQGRVLQLHVFPGRVLRQPVPDLGAVRGVGDHRVAVRPLVHEHVIQHAAGLVADQAVPHLHLLHAGDGIREDVFEQVPRVRPAEVEPGHVRDVEQAAAGADGRVLGDHARVLHGHVPAGERDHPCAEGDVRAVERRPKEVGHESEYHGTKRGRPERRATPRRSEVYSDGKSCLRAGTGRGVRLWAETPARLPRASSVSGRR